MAKKVSRSPDQKLAAKKEAVLGRTKKKSPLPFLAMAACAALVIAGGMFFLGQQKDAAPPAAQVFATPAEASEVTYPVDLFADGKCRFFEHTSQDGLTIRYFILKSSDGLIRSAFDACDSCWSAGKGYRQDGDEMVCQNCRMRFASVKVMEVKGGCNPSPLANMIRGDQVVIRVADILAGRQYFDLKREG